jgi:hypothetical protein
VRCIFVPDDDFLSPGITYCSQEIVTISGGDCYTDGYRLYYQDEIHSVREYRGNVVLPGFNGVEVEGEFGDVVRPNAKLISDVGGVTFFAFFVPDESCTV